MLNVPLTYPAKPLSGIMVSGFVALDYRRAAYPSWVADWMKDTGYRLEADFERVHSDRDAFLADLDMALLGREKLLDRFWDEEWDLFSLVVTDNGPPAPFLFPRIPGRRTHHRVFSGFLPPPGRVDRPGGGPDGGNGRPARPGCPAVMLSDHGFAPVRQEFHLNRWLAAHGYQGRHAPDSEDLALALDPTVSISTGRPVSVGAD